MDFGPALYQSKGYIVSTPIFEGPLDLLLYLIERSELDITKLALAKVTDQYLEHLKNIQEQRADEVSAFLVIAARLLQIKSEALLPRPPVREPGEEDPGDALVQQLLIYKRFKEKAVILGEWEAAGMHTYLRLAQPPHLDLMLDPGDLTLADLVAAAQAVFNKEVDERQPLDDVVTPPKVTIRQQIHHIANNLRTIGRVTFLQLLSEHPSVIEIIVTFLAVLELTKRQLVKVQQENLFGSIMIDNEGLSADTEIFDLEFVE
jgi:segregation and condensation protein A